MTKAKRSDPASLARAVSIKFIEASGGYAVKAPQQSKAPARGWDPRANTLARSQQLLSEIEFTDDNIGVHVHGPLIDIDVDAPDAGDFLTPALDLLLPHCNHVWGRGARKRTHRAYLLRDDNFDPSEHSLLKRLKRIEEAKVEIRGGPSTRGEYVLLPGSVHPSGDTYEWANLGDAKNTPTVTSLSTILKALRMASAIAVLAPHWNEGYRQHLVMAMAGMLYRNGATAEAMGGDAFYLDKDDSRRLIEVLMKVTDDDRKDYPARMKAFDATWSKGEDGGNITGAPTIDALVGDNVSRKLFSVLTESPDLQILDYFSNRFAIWQGPGVMIDLEAVQAGVPKPMLTRQAMQNSFGDKWVQSGDKRRLACEVLWSMPNVHRVQGLCFDPNKSPHSVVDKDRGKSVNQWGGFEIEPYSDPVADEEISPFLDYIKEIVCDLDEGAAEWTLGWLADIFQDPGNKPGTALVLVGAQGAGKSVLGDSIIAPIIGRQHYGVSNSITQITKDFNAAFAGKLLINCNEAVNNRQKSVTARMKSIITDPLQLVEHKGVDAFYMEAHSRLLFTSNDEEDAIHLEAGDRRYTILKVSPHKAHLVTEFWLPFIEWLESPDILAKIHRWFKDYRYKKTTIRRPYQTEAKRLMQQHSWNPMDAWLAEWVMREHPIREEFHKHWFDAFIDRSNRDIDRSGWPAYVRVSTLAADFNVYSSKVNGPRTSEHALVVALEKRGLPFRGKIRVNASYYDARLQQTVQTKVRVQTPPRLDDVRDYLIGKYEVDVSGGMDDEVLTDASEELKF